MRNISSIIFIIISIALFFVVVNPMYVESKKIKNDVDVYNTALTNATRLQKIRDDLVQNYKKVTDSDKNKLDHFLPNTADNIQLILQIQNIATVHGMVLKNIKFDNPSDGAKVVSSQAPTANTVKVGGSESNSVSQYGTFNLSFSADARYEDFIAFLKDIESNIRLIDVKSISFSVPTPTDKSVKSPQGDNTPVDPSVYTYTLQVETYWLK